MITGLGQVAFTAIFGYLIGLALGLGHVTSLYVAVALTFSSTIIIVKLLSDKREIDALHGQIALGFLIVQDLVVVLAMIVLSAIGIGAARMAGMAADRSRRSWLRAGHVRAGRAVRALCRRPSDRAAGPCAGTAGDLRHRAGGDVRRGRRSVGLGKEVGGLLAGVALASTPYRETIAARLAPLRDFLLLFFFIALGAALDLSLLGAM